jgi:uncharacterized membrane-anchored protein YhcB (DUF1043 family)
MNYAIRNAKANVVNGIGALTIVALWATNHIGFIAGVLLVLALFVLTTATMYTAEDRDKLMAKKQPEVGTAQIVGQYVATPKGKRTALIIGAALVVLYVGLALTYKPAPPPAQPTQAETQMQVKRDMVDLQHRMLETRIRATARNPKTLEFGKQKTYENGVCVDVNGQNAFGGYTGFKEYCYLMENGKPVFTINGEIQ